MSRRNWKQNHSHNRRRKNHDGEKRDTSWSRVEDFNGPVSVDFPDYVGEKLHEYPDLPNCHFLLEIDVGIAQYISFNLPGFSAILKHRFSDFVVHEIDVDGNVVKLTDESVKIDQIADAITDVKEIPTFAQLAKKEQGLFSQLTWTRIVQLAKNYLLHPDQPGGDNDLIKIDVEGKDKEHRTAVHKCIKEHFPHMHSNTVTDGGKTFIVTKYCHGVPVKERNKWPRDRPKNLTFTMYKEGMDSMAVLIQLTKALGQHGKVQFRMAGTKDKRARTSQKVTIGFVTATRLQKAVQKLKSNPRQRVNVNVGNFSYQKTGLELGDLQGNKFTIALRHVQGTTREIIDEALTSLKTKGFINYFGLQRFGNYGSVKTSDIGLALVKENWSEAVELVMKPRANEGPQMTRTRAHWWMYRQPKDALVLLGGLKHRSIEGTLLEGLGMSHKNDFLGAFSNLPKNSKLLYLHAYQALIWNKVVSRRFAQYGPQVLLGDFVIATTDFVMDKTEKDDEVEEDEELNKREKKEAQMVVVTQENKDQFGLEHVIMPVPGYKVKYPQNEEVKKMYLEALAEDGLEDGFDSLNNGQPFYALPGDYRKMVSKPLDLQWKHVKYDEPNEDLILSDLDEMQGKTKSEKTEGKYDAVIIDMSLPSSMYATMALREVLKTDTGKGTQTLLTDSHNNQDTAEKKPLQEEEEEEEEEGQKDNKRAKMDNE